MPPIWLKLGQHAIDHDSAHLRTARPRKKSLGPPLERRQSLGGFLVWGAKHKEPNMVHSKLYSIEYMVYST